ncbi:MAG: glycoside hydrolase family 3 C-terminal domain-containing protein, partial [Oscillospiraceae bacterium]|nr:glycoside hydrolase family 3 C-terminal domain-containing protein [Oscillospiraceae bacterium]
MYPMVSGVLNASKAEIADDVVANSLAVVQETGEEGMVLLKNNGLLPLGSDVSALNVFGWASAHPVFSGTGSAASGDASIPQTDIITALNEAGFSTNEELTKMYADYGKDYWGGNRPVISMTSQDWSLPEPTTEYYTSAVMSGAEAFSDTAVIVIGRSGGENADLPSDMKAVIDGTFDVAATDAVQQSVAHNYNSTRATFYNNTREYDEFGEGDHYLQLSQSEKNLVDTVCSSFDKVIVVINANNVMELGWVEDYEQIGAVILAPGTGASGMKALGEILNGSVNPSGKTVDTYLYDLTSAPNWNHTGNSGNHLYTNVSDLTKQLARIDNTFNGVVSFTDYVEGIYMGYKFYETAAEEGLLDFEKTVQYPFGYGLSYTSFTQEITSFNQSGDYVDVEITVTNTGSVAGKDVVELYYTPPYTNGGIEKASVNLLDFGKTGLL